MKKLISVVLVSAAIGLIPAARADDPSLHEVYQAVHAGRLSEAQAMMATVLRDHPDSAKAHYVEAEVLARMGRTADAQSELEHAERLAPGLSFAKPEALGELRALIAQGGRGHLSVADRAALSDGHASDASFPWVPLLIVGGAGVLVFLFLRARRSAAAALGGPGVSPAGAPYGVSPYGAAPMGGPGIGSGIVGGLATGAALGAGMVAGEALAHEFMGNRDRDRIASDNAADGSRAAIDDGGSPDFGVNDSGSWDAGGSDFGSDGGGGGDWG